MKNLKDLLTEAISDTVYVVKDSFDKAILNVFDNEDEAQNEIETRMSENPNLKLTISKEKRSQYIDNSTNA